MVKKGVWNVFSGCLGLPHRPASNPNFNHRGFREIEPAKFGGRIYPKGDPTFYLLIDTKTDANKTYAVLRQVLADYPDLLTRFEAGKAFPKAITVVLTGNRPREILPGEAVRLAGLDGEMPDLEKANPDGVFLWMKIGRAHV